MYKLPFLYYNNHNNKGFDTIGNNVDLNNNVEICWFGRGGQGSKTASALFAELIFSNGKYAQAFPEYGAERRGAPTKAYNRISNKPIRKHCSINDPNIYIIMDSTLITDKFNFNNENAIYIVNSNSNINGNGNIITIDATKIAIDKLGFNQPNTVILGVLSKLFKIKKEMFIEFFKRKMNKLTDSVIASNINAFEIGYQHVE
jgi:pyruvate ferredoxin oxidoreductase gamma subunit